MSGFSMMLIVIVFLAPVRAVAQSGGGGAGSAGGGAAGASGASTGRAAYRLAREALWDRPNAGAAGAGVQSCQNYRLRLRRTISLHDAS
jgi:hypothetical protein